MAQQVSFVRALRYAVFLVTSAIFELLVIVSSPAEAAIVVWDDDGGSASKLWSNNNNWNPNGSPAGDDVYVGVNSVGTNIAAAANDRTLFDLGITIASLTVGNGADVVNSTDDGATNDFEIAVIGNTVIGGAGSRIFIYGGDTDGLDTDNLTINSGGVLLLNSTTPQGTAVVEIDGTTGSGQLAISEGGTLIGTGRIDLEAAPGMEFFLLVNNGSIIADTQPAFIGQAPAAGTLQITATSANARFAWNGFPFFAVGSVQINGNQTLDVDVSTSGDAWGGDMNLFTGSTLDMRDAWSMNTGAINVNTPAFGFVVGDPNPGPAARIAGAAWSMTGGTITVDDAWDSLQFDSPLTATGGTINNSGTLIFNADATIGAGVDFNMLGFASLVVNATVNIDVADFDLDSSNISENGTTTINAGGNLDLDLGVGADPDFSHTINLNGGELDVTSSATTYWTLDFGGIINAAGGATSTINSAGETFFIAGDINVTANSTLAINSVSHFTGDRNVVIDAGSTLDMANATYNSGSYTGGGLFRPGNFTIISDTTFDFPTGTVDLDDGSTSTVNALLTVNASSVETSFPDGYDGTLNIANAGRLNVNITGGGSWRLDGTINYNGDATAGVFLGGSRLVIQSGAVLNVNGEGTTIAPLDIAGRININDGNEDFALGGGSALGTAIHNLADGTIDGPGQLEIPNTSRLIGFGTIDAPIRAIAGIFPGGDVLADGGTLTINSEIISGDIIGTNSPSGVLEISAFAAFNTIDVTALELNGGSVIGTVGQNGIIRGFGTVATNGLFNQGRIQATGNGLLVIDTVSNPILDGSFGPGTEITSIEATDGNLQVVDPLGNPYNTNAVVGAGRFISFDSGWTLSVSGELFLNGGATPATAASINGGQQVLGDAFGVATVHVDQHAQFNAPTTFGATVVVNLNDGNDLLRLASNSTVAAGATFNGLGRLVNLAGATLTTADNANIGVTVENQGTLAIGSSPGDLDVEAFTQTSTGTLEIELANVTPGSFDVLTVQGNAVLGGTLDVSLTNPFEPILGNNFTILETIFGNVSGNFTIENVPVFNGLTFDVIYNSQSVILQVVEAVALAGDYNQNGIVDAADYTVWRDNLGAPAGTLVNDVDGGVIGPAQYATWQSNFGAMLGSGSGAVGSVPEPSSLVLGMMLAIGCFSMTAVLSRRRAE